MRTIVCHGDSLTEGSDLEKNYAWPRITKKLIQTYRLLIEHANIERCTEN